MKRITNSDAPPPPSASFVLRGHSHPVHSISFNFLSDCLISGTTEGEIKVWNMSNKRCVATTLLPPSPYSPSSGVVKIHPIDKSTFLSQDSIGRLVVWSMKEGSLVVESEWNPYGVNPNGQPSPLWQSTAVPFSRSAINHCSPNVVAVAAGHRDDQYIDLLDTRQRSLIQTFKDKEKLGLCMSIEMYNREGMDLICGAFENGSLRWWDSRVPDLPLTFVNKIHNEPVLCFDIDSNFVGVSGGADDHLSVFKLDTTNNTASSLQKIDLPTSGIADIKIRPDKKLFVTAGWDHRLRVFSWKKYTPLAILKFHSEGLTCVDFSAFNNNNNHFWLAAASKDKRISLWDIYNN